MGEADFSARAELAQALELAFGSALEALANQLALAADGAALEAVDPSTPGRDGMDRGEPTRSRFVEFFLEASRNSGKLRDYPFSQPVPLEGGFDLGRLESSAQLAALFEAGFLHWLGSHAPGGAGCPKEIKSLLRGEWPSRALGDAPATFYGAFSGRLLQELKASGPLSRAIGALFHEELAHEPEAIQGAKAGDGVLSPMEELLGHADGAEDQTPFPEDRASPPPPRQASPLRRFAGKTEPSPTPHPLAARTARGSTSLASRVKAKLKRVVVALAIVFVVGFIAFDFLLSRMYRKQEELRTPESMAWLGSVAQEVAAHFTTPDPAARVGPRMASKFKYVRSLIYTGATRGMTLEEVQNNVRNWVAGVRASPAPTPMDEAKTSLIVWDFARARSLGLRQGAMELQMLPPDDPPGSGRKNRISEAFEIAADASTQLELYEEASLSYSKALEFTPRGEQPARWALLMLKLGYCHGELARLAEGEEFEEHANTGLRAHTSLLEVFNREKNPLDWARMQTHAGAYLLNVVEKVDGERARELLTAATTAFQAALEVFTPESPSFDWVVAQENLAHALAALAVQFEGEERLARLRDSLRAHEATLTFYKRQSHPAFSGAAQKFIGDRWKDVGLLLSDGEALAAFERSAAAYNAILEATADQPNQAIRGTALGNLGLSLHYCAAHLEGEAALARNVEAVAAFRAAAQIITRQASPGEWALNQSNLGFVLHALGRGLRGESAATRLREAVDAYRASMTVYTPATFPAEWATAQKGVGIALSELARILGGAERRVSLHESIAAFEAALQVLTAPKYPAEHAETIRELQQARALLKEI